MMPRRSMAAAVHDWTLSLSNSEYREYISLRDTFVKRVT